MKVHFLSVICCRDGFVINSAPFHWHAANFVLLSYLLFSTKMFLHLCFKVKFISIAHFITANAPCAAKCVSSKLIKADLSRETKDDSGVKAQQSAPVGVA